jgi:hypothetical protein
MWDLPVPLFPKSKRFSFLDRNSHRASSSTSVRLREGIARKSNGVDPEIETNE